MESLNFKNWKSELESDIKECSNYYIMVGILEEAKLKLLNEVIGI